MLHDYDVALLATLPMQLLQVAAQLFAEVAPTLLATATGDDSWDLRLELNTKAQEFALNYTITPEVIDAHQKLTRYVVDLGYGRVCERCIADPVIAIVKQVAVFARAICLLAEHYAPDSNPYAALVGDEFMADSQRIQALARRQ